MNDSERGAAAAIVVLFALAMLTVAGLVIDGGNALGAHRRAMNIAEQAARVGSDALDESDLRDGTVRVDPAAANAAALDYMRAAGVDGDIAVDGAYVTVTVHLIQSTALLSAVGIESFQVTERATATSIDRASNDLGVGATR